MTDAVLVYDDGPGRGIRSPASHGDPGPRAHTAGRERASCSRSVRAASMRHSSWSTRTWRAPTTASRFRVSASSRSTICCATSPSTSLVDPCPGRAGAPSTRERHEVLAGVRLRAPRAPTSASSSGARSARLHAHRGDRRRHRHGERAAACGTSCSTCSAPTSTIVVLAPTPTGARRGRRRRARRRRSRRDRGWHHDARVARPRAAPPSCSPSPRTSGARSTAPRPAGAIVVAAEPEIAEGRGRASPRTRPAEAPRRGRGRDSTAGRRTHRDRGRVGATRVGRWPLNRACSWSAPDRPVPATRRHLVSLGARVALADPDPARAASVDGADLDRRRRSSSFDGLRRRRDRESDRAPRGADPRRARGRRTRSGREAARARPRVELPASARGRCRPDHGRLQPPARTRRSSASCELVTDGTVGEIAHARAWFGSYLPDWRPTVDYRTSYSARSGHSAVACSWTRRTSSIS